MAKDFLDIQVGDKVIVHDEYSHDYEEHVLLVESIEYDDEWITETNPKGMHCYGTDLEEEEYGDAYITVIHEGNFCGIVMECQCPLGGDETNDCADCAYSGDYHFINGECVRRGYEETVCNRGGDTRNDCKHCACGLNNHCVNGECVRREEK